MADSNLGGLGRDIAHSPAADRLKEELRAYVQARAEHAVSDLGKRVGDRLNRLAEPGQGVGGLPSGLLKAGQALTEGKSPAQVLGTLGKEQLKDKVKSMVGMGGKGKKGGGKTKSVTIIEDIDVGVPVREAYDQWTRFQDFGEITKGVQSVDKADDTESNWTAKVFKSTRSWRANTLEQIPDKRIAWTSQGEKASVSGAVTFHAVTDDLTRVLLVLEYFPKGFFEKTGNIWRAGGRRARLDLKLYRKFVMTNTGEPPEGWRGEIRDGEVVMDHDEAVRREQEEQEEQEENEEPVEDRDEIEGRGEDEEEEENGRYEDEEEPDRAEDDEDRSYEDEDEDEDYDDEAEDETEQDRDRDDEADEDRSYEDEDYDEPEDARDRDDERRYAGRR